MRSTTRSRLDDTRYLHERLPHADLDANGNPQKIDVGGKVAWQYGTNDIGALYVRSSEEGSVPGEDFAVLRAKHRMFRQSYVGMLYTGRNTRNSDAGMLQTFGADFLLSTSTFLGSENLSAGGFFLDTTNPQDSGKSKAFGLLVDYPNDPWSSSVLYREIQEHYQAAVGFTPRTGFRRLAPNVQYTVRPRQHPWVRTVVFGVDTAFQMDTADNELLNRDLDATLVLVGLARGWGLEARGWDWGLEKHGPNPFGSGPCVCCYWFAYAGRLGPT